MGNGVDWNSLSALGSVIAALVALLALWRATNTDNQDLRIRPLIESLARLDELLDKFQMMNSTFRQEVREEFLSLSRQMTGIQVTMAERYTTKKELDVRIADVRREIEHTMLRQKGV